MLVKLATSILTLSLLVGCGWNEMENWDSQGIWSDDGTAALGVYQFYEGNDTPTHIRKRNMETVVYYFPRVSDDALPRIILPRAPGWTHSLYLSGLQDYAIIHRKEKLPDLDDGANETANYTAYKVSLDGEVTSLGQRQYLSMISCDGGQSATTTGDVLTVIPSPDGTILAKVEMSVTCRGRDGQLTFLDAQSLQQLAPAIVLPRVADVSMLMTRAWSEDGRFMVAESSFMGPRGMSYLAGTEPQAFAQIDYSCLYPETASGSVNSQGQYLQIVDGQLRANPPEANNPTFGCD
ncbi:MAG: hypothetical protein CMH52_14135 [Myxococcales bacterium]|nr:hypothetical protein [Myxococcales bacterium]|tara:strand:+ start:660 stop:1538 length:879 start_codon:yes stop_codon:yes gene_type:complete